MATDKTVRKRPGRVAKRRQTQRRLATHHFAWYDCMCVESGSMLHERELGAWCRDLEAVRALKERSRRQCGAMVGAEAAVIASWQETLSIYSPYVFEFVHLAFPRRRFPTRRAAKRFLAEALSTDEPYELLHPYLKESSQRTFDLSKDQVTGKVDVTMTDEDDDSVFSDFLDSFE